MTLKRKKIMLEDEVAVVPEDVVPTTEPKVAGYSQEIIDCYPQTDIKALELCISNNSPALLVGQTGIGKTTLVAELAKKAGKNLTRLSVHSGVTADEILGKWLAKNGSTVWQDGLLIQAMQKGDWIVFDEINACPADVLFALHSLLDDDRKVTLIEKDGVEIRPHADFRFFATMNPIEDYAGTKELNMAFYSRFGAVIEIKPFEAMIEVGILIRKGIDPNHASQLVNLASNLRIYKASDDIVFFCGTRDLIHAGKLYDSGMQFKEAIAFGVFNKMSKDDREYVLSKDLSLVIKDKKEQEIEELKAELSSVKKVNSGLEAKATALNDELKKAQSSNANLDNKTLNALKKLGIATK